MRNLFILSVLFSIISAQKSIQTSSIPNNQIGMSSGIFLNIGTSGVEADGYIEFQTGGGFFIESSAITQFEKYSALNSSLGFMKEFYPDMHFGAGYSNYFETNDSSLNEAFLAYRYRMMTGLVFFGLGREVSPNFLGIFDLNLIFPKVPFDCSLTGIISEYTNKAGYDLILNASKTFKSGFTFGVLTSHERYETEESFSFIKQGNEKSISIPVLDQGLFISLFLGWIL